MSKTKTKKNARPGWRPASLAIKTPAARVWAGACLKAGIDDSVRYGLGDEFRRGMLCACWWLTNDEAFFREVREHAEVAGVRAVRQASAGEVAS